jgi:hypothetical protein
MLPQVFCYYHLAEDELVVQDVDGTTNKMVALRLIELAKINCSILPQFHIYIDKCMNNEKSSLTPVVNNFFFPVF